MADTVQSDNDKVETIGAGGKGDGSKVDNMLEKWVEETRR
jgi:hypothetical protein